MLSNETSEAETDISAISISSGDSGNVSHDLTSEDRLNFELRSHVKERNAKKLWAIEFNTLLRDDQPKIFVALGGAQYSIYECTEKGTIKLLMRFVDPDSNEDFWSCCWAANTVTRRSILITGGGRGVIRLIEPEMENINEENGGAKHFIGHGGAVNQLKIAPKKPYLLASASSDHSIRLWNIETMVCIATFHGENGHRDQVATIDFNRDSTKLISGGLDHMVAIWDLTVPHVKNAIEKSRSYNGKKAERGFNTVLHMNPIFRSRRIHCNYVDCVQYINELILSKSNVNDLYCWSPLANKNAKITAKALDNFDCIAHFNVKKCSYYFMRFATDANKSLMALGNDVGDVYIWDLQTDDPANFPYKILQHAKRVSTARDVSFSRNGQDLVVCCDDGSIWYYQQRPKMQSK